MLDWINEGFFGGFFDFDGNGKLDVFEEALEIAAIDYIINGDEDSPDEDNDSDEEELTDIDNFYDK